MISSFLLIGQSNMVGCGIISPENQIKNPDIFVFKSGGWHVAEEPYHEYSPNLGTGLAASFADTINREYSVKIGLIPCAMGGSKISQWQPGEPLFEKAVSDTREALKTSTLKGILWHQGENDANISAQHALAYAPEFWRMFHALYAELDAGKIPFVMGEIGSFLTKGNCPFWPEINGELTRIAEKDPRIELVSSDGLTHGGDFVHFDTPTLRELGIRYARGWESAAKRLGTEL